jgi:hypothetical protein
MATAELTGYADAQAVIEALDRALGAPQFHGFEGRTGSSLSIADAILFLAVPTAQSVWLNGTEYALTEGLSLDLGETPTEGGHYIVAQDDGAGALKLAELPGAWSITDTSYTPVAYVYWQGGGGAVMDERHGHSRNLEQHAYLHHTVGARIQNDGSFAQTRPTTANDGQLELVAGSLWDEDIENEITTAQGKLVRNWYETASGVWTWGNGADNGGYDRPYIWNSGTSRLRYPNTGSSYALTDCADNRFLALWVYASNDVDRPIYVVTPALAATYTTVANARAALAPALPFAPELKLLYRWIYRGDGEYQEAADYRTAASLPSGGVSAPVAASVTFSPSGTIAATNVQAAIEEVASEAPNLATANTWTAKQTFNLFEAAGGTLVADAPAIISQTWNNAAVAFTGLKVDVTNTASASLAIPFGVFIGGSPLLRLNTSGTLLLNLGTSLYFSNAEGNAGYSVKGNSGNDLRFYGNGVFLHQFSSSNYAVRREACISWTSTQHVEPLSAYGGTALWQDSDGILAQRNTYSGATNLAQAFRLYGTWTDDTNYQRLGVISAKQALTAAAGATVATTTLSIPKYSHLIGVTTRVTTALGETNGTTGYTVGDGTDPDLWGAVTGVAIGTTTAAPDYTAVDALGPDGSDRTVTLTAVGGNFDGTGVIDVCAFYLRAEAD